MPEAVLHPFMVMMPRLLAEEQLELVNALVATGGMQLEQKESFHGFLADLERRAGGRPPERRRVPRAGSVDAVARFGGNFVRATKVEKVGSIVPAGAKPGQQMGRHFKNREEVRTND